MALFESGTICKENRLLTRFLKDESGFAAIMSGVMLPALILTAALATEGGYWYYSQRKIQNAADTAAYASILKLMGGKSDELTSAATLVALTNGYSSSLGPITVNHPPLIGAYAGNKNAVEVTITQNLPRYLSAMASPEDVVIISRAVAKLDTEQLACMLSLSNTASGAVTFSGSSNTTLNNCRLAVNSIADDAIKIQGGADVSVDCASTAGGASTTSGLVLTKCPSVAEYQPQIADPFAALGQKTSPLACADKVEFEKKKTGIGYPDPNQRYCGGISLNSGAEVELSEGYYIFDGGDIRVNAAASLIGEKVVIFLTGGAKLTFNGGATIKLSSPLTGDYAGIVIFGDRNDNVTHQVNGNSDSFYNGAIYTAGARMVYNGSSAIGGGCVQLVADTMEIGGNTSLNADCAGSPYTATMVSTAASLTEAGSGTGTIGTTAIVE